MFVIVTVWFHNKSSTETPNALAIFAISQLAEGVGLEPTNGFLDRHGLANRLLDHLHTLPKYLFVISVFQLLCKLPTCAK